MSTLNEKIIQKDKDRFKLIFELYKITNGDRRTRVDLKALGETIGLKGDSFYDAYDHLQDYDLIQSSGAGYNSLITRNGIELVELELINKEKEEEEPFFADFENPNGKLFISHSTKDTDIVHSFIEHILMLGLGVKREDIFCTSLDGCGIKSGADFKKAIKDELTNAKAVIQIITRNYKLSEVCLNEMGAAWILNSYVIPLVMPPDDYDVGFIHGNSQQLLLNNKDNLLTFYDDHKDTLFTSKVTITNYLKQVQKFNDYIDNQRLSLLM